MVFPRVIIECAVAVSAGLIVSLFNKFFLNNPRLQRYIQCRKDPYSGDMAAGCSSETIASVEVPAMHV